MQHFPAIVDRDGGIHERLGHAVADQLEAQKAFGTRVSADSDPFECPKARASAPRPRLYRVDAALSSSRVEWSLAARSQEMDPPAATRSSRRRTVASWHQTSAGEQVGNRPYETPRMTGADTLCPTTPRVRGGVRGLRTLTWSGWALMRRGNGTLNRSAAVVWLNHWPRRNRDVVVTESSRFGYSNCVVRRTLTP